MVRHVGLRVKQVREQKEITQESLAEKTGLSWSCISRFENGKTMVSLEKLINIAEKLDVGLNVLLCDYIKTDMSLDYLSSEILNSIVALSDNDKKYILENIALITKHYKSNNKSEV